MEKFIKKVVVFLIVAFIVSEIICALFVDGIYFYKLDTYNFKKATGLRLSKDTIFDKDTMAGIILRKKTRHVDYLFIGSSRVPATINPEVFMMNDHAKVAIVAGRAGATAGVHYQALKKRLLDFPNYLKNANVFIEYAGSKQYEKAFKNEQYHVLEPELPNSKPMPALLLPHFTGKTFFEFIKKSTNSLHVKSDMFLLYVSSLYRSISFVNEIMERLDSPMFIEKDQLLASDGGIRNDKILLARNEAIRFTNIAITKSNTEPVITFESLNKSTLAYFNKLINENGGKLYLYKMPLHSMQNHIYNSQKEKRNRVVFEEWLNNNKIIILPNKKFKYNDSDFPDIWHLSINRRDEFSLLLLKEFKNRLAAKF